MFTLLPLFPFVLLFNRDIQLFPSKIPANDLTFGCALKAVYAQWSKNELNRCPR